MELNQNSASEGDSKMAKENLSKEIKEIGENICLVGKGKRPRSSFARNVLIREGYVKFVEKGKKFGEGDFKLTEKGRRIKKLFKC